MVSKIPFSLPGSVKFVKPKQKFLDAQYEEVDSVNLSTVTEKELDDIIMSEHLKQINNDKLIELLIQTDENENDVTRKTIKEKIENYLKKKAKNLEKIQKKLAEERNRELTFKPNLYRTKKPNHKLRKFEDFIKAQWDHIEKVRNRISQIRLERNDSDKELYREKPEINKNSRIMFSKNDDSKSSVYDRLYAKRNNLSRALSQSTSTSTISRKKVDINYLNSLFQDAAERDERMRQRDLISTNQLLALHAKSSYESNKILYKKFSRDFQNEISIVNDEDDKLTTLQAVKVIIGIGFVEEKKITENDKILINNILVSLSNENKIIVVDHLFIFFLAIVGLLKYYIKTHCLNSNNLSDKEIDKELSSRIQTVAKYGGFDSNLNYLITISQSKKISLDYISFCQRWNKNFSQNCSKARSQSGSFILPRPASTSSVRTMKTEGSLFTHIKQTKARKLERINTISTYKSKREEEEMSNCTFKPKINSSFRSFSKNLESSSSEALYKKGLIKQMRRRNRDPNEAEYESQKTECTFKPSLNNNFHIIYNSRKKKLIEIDVGLQNGVKKKLNVYEGDNVKDVVEQFGLENNLNSKKRERLLSLISTYIK